MGEHVNVGHSVLGAPGSHHLVNQWDIVCAAGKGLPAVETLVDGEEAEVVDLRLRTLLANGSEELFHSLGHLNVGEMMADIINSASDENLFRLSACNLPYAVEHSHGIIAAYSSVYDVCAGIGKALVPTASKLGEAVAEHDDIIRCNHW